MPDFKPFILDIPEAQQQVQELKASLDGSADLREAALRAFLKPRLQLQSLIGSYNSSFGYPDLHAWEYPIFGDFRCDFAVGDFGQKAYTFVECENARPNSLFVKQGKKATRALSSRFDSGYSQIIDWFHKLQGMMDTPDMEARFGKRAIRYVGVLLIGRDQFLTPGEQLRLEWREQPVVVNSKHIFCVTYDQLLRKLQLRLDKFGVPQAN